MGYSPVMGPDSVDGQPRPITAAELQAVIHAERRDEPFLVYRDAEGGLQTVTLAGDVTVGRNAEAALSIYWDDQVSGLHAELNQLGGELTLVDDGLSRNGSYVNGERVHGRRRLRDGDRLQFGRTVVLVRRPTDGQHRATAVAIHAVGAPIELSVRQREVLTALCRPLTGSNPFAAPASNRHIAEELFLSVPAVKLHLRALFDKFGVEELPQNEKRLALVGRARASGLVPGHGPSA
ncbi:MAG TPA: FHA domain-containing protein [Solirubrobacteraceae bacterium]